MLTSNSILPRAGYLQGHLLVATPAITGSCFSKALLYMCVHNEGGAMGIIVNQPVKHMRFADVLSQLDIPLADPDLSIPVHFGGPMESGRGFILHTADVLHADSVRAEDEDIAVTSSLGMLKDIASGSGPQKAFLALGYAGWGPGQLEAECASGGWISVPATAQLLFHTDHEHQWQLAAQSIGIDMLRLSTTVGHA